MSILYKKGYKYQLTETYTVEIGIKPDKAIVTDFISLSTDGFLRMFKGYAWDGVTCWRDTKKLLRGSLVHDALYQLIRLKFLPEEARRQADEELKKIVCEDKTSIIFGKCMYHAVRLFGKKAATVSRTVFTAP